MVDRLKLIEHAFTLPQCAGNFVMCDHRNARWSIKMSSTTNIVDMRVNAQGDTIITVLKVELTGAMTECRLTTML